MSIKANNGGPSMVITPPCPANILQHPAHLNKLTLLLQPCLFFMLGLPPLQLAMNYTYETNPFCNLHFYNVDVIFTQSL